MSGPPHLRGGMQQRPPLQPRGTLQNYGANSSTSGENPTSPSNGLKRLSSEALSNSVSENDFISSVFNVNKRQRMKSGPDTMDLTNDSNWNNHTNGELNACYRTNNSGVVNSENNGNDKDLIMAVECSRLTENCESKDRSNSENEYIYSTFSNSSDSDVNRCTANYLSNGINNNIDNLDAVGNNLNSNKGVICDEGGMSPHCAATLEYVTQLPEGCSNRVNGSSDVLVNGSAENIASEDKGCKHTDSDDELEDDDNYLDSSEPEDNDVLSSALSANEDDESCGEDDQSVISSVTVGSTSSLRSVASETMSSIVMNENGVASNEDGSLLYNHIPAAVPLSSLTPSMFSHVPPTVNFCKYNESTAKRPEDIAKLLKWRLTTITPLIVKKTIVNSGYKITKKTALWCGTWGKHMKSPVFKGIKDYQKVNHFPGTFQIGRKDKLWKNFARLQAKFGKDHFGFIPKTFVLPGDLKALKAAFDKEGVKKKWIVKPPASARGTGIQVVNKWSQMPMNSPVVVQRYISMPYLINNTKFDIRIYVLVTSFDPLRIFLYEDGLVRFASVQYQKNSKNLSDRFMHLTNYSVNKTSSSYTHNDDAGHCQGHKWTLKTLWGYLKAQDIDTGALWSRIADLVIKTVLAGESDIVARTKKNTRSMYNCFELFGFDVILDEKLRPWLLEVNISPSLHSASSLDHSVKGPLIADLLNLVGFHIPDKLSQEKQVELLKYMNMSEKVSGLCLDRRLYTRLNTPEEQSKHVKMITLSRSQYLSTILDNLLPDDVRNLLISEDQRNRAGKFACIFPTPDTHNYFGFLDKVRYYNRLMDAWENSYSTCREKGIELLENLCKDQVHLKVTARFKLPKAACLPPAEKCGLTLLPPFTSSCNIGHNCPNSAEKNECAGPTGFFGENGMPQGDIISKISGEGATQSSGQSS